MKYIHNRGRIYHITHGKKVTVTHNFPGMKITKDEYPTICGMTYVDDDGLQGGYHQILNKPPADCVLCKKCKTLAGI